MADNQDSQLIEQGLKSLHAKLENYTYSTSSKLDNIIELAKQMAAIQERQQRHSDDIQRLEVKVGAIEEQKNISIERVHKRLDDITSGFDAKLDSAITKTGITLREMAKDVEALDEDYKANKNFVRGAMWVVTGVFFILQGIGLKYVTDLQNQISARDASIVRIEKTVQELQNIILLQQRQK